MAITLRCRVCAYPLAVVGDVTTCPACGGTSWTTAPVAPPVAGDGLKLSLNDKRFLKALRIGYE